MRRSKWPKFEGFGLEQGVQLFKMDVKFQSTSMDLICQLVLQTLLDLDKILA